jgi:hypothetical protein
MNIEKETSGFNDFSFTEKVRILNILIYGLIIFFANIYEHFMLALLFIYIHIFVSLLFLVLELRYLILTKKSLLKHIFTNWLVLIGFVILLFNFLKIFLKIDVLRLVL